MNKAIFNYIIEKDLQNMSSVNMIFRYISGEIYGEYYSYIPGAGILHEFHNKYKEIVNNINDEFYFYIKFEIDNNELELFVKENFIDRLKIFYDEKYNYILDLYNVDKRSLSDYDFNLYDFDYNINDKQKFYRILEEFIKFNKIEKKNEWYKFTVNKIKQLYKILWTIDKKKIENLEKNSELIAFCNKNIAMNEYKIGFTKNKRKRISTLSCGLKNNESFRACIRNSFRDVKLAKRIFKIIADDKNIDKEIYCISAVECEEIFKFCEHIEEILFVNSS